MKRSSKYLTAAILSIGLVAGVAAHGKYKSGGSEARAQRMVDYITQELNLDASQAQSLDVLKEQMLTTVGALRTELTPVRDEIRNLLAAETFDQARALELINARASAMTSAAPDLLSALGNFLDGLDAEQKAEALEYIEHRAEHRRGRRGHGWK